MKKKEKSDRYELIKFLKDNGVKIKLFGWGWDNYPEFKDIYGGALTSEEMIKVINKSKIYLCFSKNNYGLPHIKGKVFEGGACKTFVLTEYCDEYEHLFKVNKEIVMFEGKEDLLKKIRYYLTNEKEREKIAENDYNKIIRDYNLDTDLTQIFKKISFKEDLLKNRLLSKIDKKAILLSKQDLDLKLYLLKDKIKNYDYVYFKVGWSENLPYREYLQIYSLEKTRKQISCCDYYVSTRFLKDYLRFVTEKAIKYLSKEEFSSFLNLNQIMVTKHFFLKNIKNFRKIINGEYIDFINEKNTAIISLPLIRINKIQNKNYELMRNAFEFEFLFQLFSLKLQKKLFSSVYFYALIFEIFKGKKFIFKVILKTLKDKDKSKKVSKIIKG